MQVGIVGASGYTGAELLAPPPPPSPGRGELPDRPHLRGQDGGRALSPPGRPTRICASRNFEAGDALKQAELFFICLPHGEAMQAVPQLLNGGAKVIDLSADFRLDSASQYQEWYGLEHTAVAYLEEAVYGLPEVKRAEIADARLVAVPGCYPTASTLALAPLLQGGLAGRRSGPHRRQERRLRRGPGLEPGYPLSPVRRQR